MKVNSVYYGVFRGTGEHKNYKFLSEHNLNTKIKFNLHIRTDIYIYQHSPYAPWQADTCRTESSHTHLGGRLHLSPPTLRALINKTHV